MTRKAEPILKWPGGKRRLYKHIVQHVPSDYTGYYEPFIGGGAVYLGLSPENAVIADINTQLINFYQQVQADPEGIIAELSDTEKYANTLENYLDIRKLDRDEDVFASLTPTQKAARILYLNKTCFNGLYRENMKGQFNAHYGHYKNPPICDAELIKAVHESLNRNIQILESGFGAVLDGVEGTKNLIYLDPPYIPLSPTSSFTSYSKDKFTLPDQEELRDQAKRLDAAGNYVLLSNSDTPLTRELYEGFTFHEVHTSRNINVKGTGRGKIGELIIIGPTLAARLAEEAEAHQDTDTGEPAGA